VIQHTSITGTRFPVALECRSWQRSKSHFNSILQTSFLFLMSVISFLIPNSPLCL